jgi:hypothetical protein
MNIAKFIQRGFLLSLTSLLIIPAFATDYTFTGKAPAPNNQLWSEAQNWSPSDHPPGDGDTATIGAVHSGFTVVVDSSVTVDALTNISSTLQGIGVLTVNNAMDSVNSTLSVGLGIDVEGTFTVDPVPGIPTLNTTTVTTSLELKDTSVTSTAVLEMSPGSAIVSRGTFTLQNNTQLNVQSSGAQFLNVGTFQVTNGLAVVETSSSVFNNNGGTVLAANGGVLQFFGTLKTSGTFSTDTNSLITDSAATDFQDGAVITGDGITTLEGGNHTLEGTVTVSGEFQMGTNTLPILTLTGTLSVVENGTFTWLGGSLNGQGTNVTGMILVGTDGIMVINNLGGLTLRNTILTNNGTISWIDSGELSVGFNAQIQNAASFFATGDGSIEPIPSGPPGANIAVFDNSGVFIKAKGSTNSNAGTTIGIPFFDGHVEAEQGTLILAGGGSIEFFSVASTGAVRLNGGTFTVQNEEGLGGSGKIEGAQGVAGLGGPVTLSGNASFNFPVDGTLLIDGGGNFVQSGGPMFGTGFVSVKGGGQYVWNAGTINNLVISIESDSSMTIAGGSSVKPISTSFISNAGTLLWTNANDFGIISAGDNVVIDNSGHFNIVCDSQLSDVATNTHPVITNEAFGVITKTANTATTTVGCTVVNFGTIIAQSGNLEILHYIDTQGLFSQVSLQGGKVTFDTATVMHGNLEGSGAVTANQGITFTDDEVEILLITFFGNVTNDGTFILFFNGPGLATFQNSFIQTANGTLSIPIQGTNNSDFGRVVLAGFNQATLNGTIESHINNGFAAPIGLNYAILSSFQRNGSFSHTNLTKGFGLTYNAGGFNLTVTDVVPAQVVSPIIANGLLQFSFGTVSNRSYTIQTNGDLSTTNWGFYTNFTGNGSNQTITLPGNFPKVFVRVREP